MGEQLAMQLVIGPGRVGAPTARHRSEDSERPSDRPRHRRGRAVANRPIRGEPDVPEARPSRGDWRIDARTRAHGLRGVARARAALDATPGPDAEHGRVDAA